MSAYVAGNQVVLLRNGTEFFPALQQAIDAAEHEIHLQTYIYEVDVIGRTIADALKRAAARGVVVNVLLDGFGSKDLPKDFVREMHEAGIDLLFYRPRISPWTLRRRRLRRLHRKVAVIDGKIAFVGGINIIDDMNVPDHTPPRVDYAVGVQGPLLPEIRASVRRLWRRVAWAHLRRVRVSRLKARLVPGQMGGMWAAYVVRDNVLHRRDIEDAYLNAIDGARREIVIANSYFLPGIRFRRALAAAAHRGVRVVVLLQARVEYVLLDYATRALYDELLQAGIEIYEYQKSFMHSKVAVVDGQWATVGSSNIDPFSLLLSREANVMVSDNDFANALLQDIEQSIQSGARRVSPAEWQRAPRLRRWLAVFFYAVIRMVVGLIGYPDHR